MKLKSIHENPRSKPGEFLDHAVKPFGCMSKNVVPSLVVFREPGSKDIVVRFEPVRATF